MPVSFPLDPAEWFGLLPISAMTLDPAENVVGDMNARGEWFTDDVAPMLWRGEITLARMTQAEAAHAAVMMDLIRPSGRLFWVFDSRRPTPIADPGGLVLGTAAPVIASLSGGNRELALAGLPAGYVLQRGDYLGFDYDGTRRALHRVAAAEVIADTSGVTPVFEVSTLIQPGATPGTAVSLIRPAIPVLREIGSVGTGQMRGTITEGFTFRFAQTLQRI